MQFSLPIIKSTLYATLEKKNLHNQELRLEAMEKVGLLLFEKVLHFLERFEVPPLIILLVGKGDNGADAYVVGRHLIKSGLKVVAVEFFDEGFSPLNSYQKNQFLKARGEVIDFVALLSMEFAVIIDGVFGSGYKGELPKDLLEKFAVINKMQLPLLAIDIPSGISGDNGLASGALKATQTYYIDFPKWGFFLDDTPNFLGDLIPIFLDCVTREQIGEKIEGYLLQKEDLFLPSLPKKRHKYQAGSVVGWCGSLGMSGALNLSGLAALQVGAGIVKFLHHKKLHLTIHELILFPLRMAKKLLPKSGAFLAGPGTKKTIFSKLTFRFLTLFLKSPAVFDADAIFHISKNFLGKFSFPIAITPHHRECTDLLKVHPQIKDEDLFEKIQNFIQGLPHFFVLKGVPTIIFSQNLPKIVIYGGDPGMATAGSGDVLSGMIAGFLAQKMPMLEALTLAIYLHQKAGEIAARDYTSYSVTATKIIEKIPDAFFSLLELNEYT